MENLALLICAVQKKVEWMEYIARTSMCLPNSRIEVSDKKLYKKVFPEATATKIRVITNGEVWQVAKVKTTIFAKKKYSDVWNVQEAYNRELSLIAELPEECRPALIELSNKRKNEATVPRVTTDEYMYARDELIVLQRKMGKVMTALVNFYKHELITSADICVDTLRRDLVFIHNFEDYESVETADEYIVVREPKIMILPKS